jgi:tetratricopeptide (TPR) repeat protein
VIVTAYQIEIMRSVLDDEQRDLLKCTLQYLQMLGHINGVDGDGMEVAIQCISEATGVECIPPDETTPSLLDFYRSGLSSLLSNAGKPDGIDRFLKALTDKGYFDGVEVNSDEYNVRLLKAKRKFHDQFRRSSNCVMHAPDFNVEEKAKELKLHGNTLISNGDYLGAVKAYSEAIELDSNNAVLYANRAAA